MTLPRNTTVSVVLSAVSLGLSGYVFFLQPVFDYRLIASLVSLSAFAAVMSDFKKHLSMFLLLGIFLSMLSLGISLDHRLPAVPFISIAMLIAFLSLKKFFRQWFSETSAIWTEPLFLVSSFTVYIYANMHYGYGWKGWAFPPMVLIPVTALAMMDFVHSFGTLKYIKSKNLIHETGKAAPDFCLNDYDGNQVKLSDYSGKRDLLLMFVRGAWCPSCHIMLRTYQRNVDKFKEKNIMLFAIGPDVSEVNRQMAIDLGIDFKVLSDTGQKTAMAYRVHLPSEFVGEQYAEGMPLPASFLIDKKGIIRYTSRPDRVGEFFSPETIFPILESLN